MVAGGGKVVTGGRRSAGCAGLSLLVMTGDGRFRKSNDR